MTGTLAAGKPISWVASTTGASCTSLVTESTRRKRVSRAVST